MKCEACGGDGLIEYGAYRGDNGTDTRECLLCGGVVTVEAVESVSSPSPSVSPQWKPEPTFKELDLTERNAIQRLRHKATTARRSGSKEHVHTWERVRIIGTYHRVVEFSCSCGKAVELSKGGGLYKGSAPDSELKELAQRVPIIMLRDKVKRREEAQRQDAETGTNEAMKKFVEEYRP